MEEVIFGLVVLAIGLLSWKSEAFRGLMEVVLAIMTAFICCG